MPTTSRTKTLSRSSTEWSTKNSGRVAPRAARFPEPLWSSHVPPPEGRIFLTARTDGADRPRGRGRLRTAAPSDGNVDVPADAEGALADARRLRECLDGEAPLERNILVETAAGIEAG